MWEYYARLTRLGRDLVEKQLDGARAIAKLENLKQPLEGYREKDFCLSEWQTTFRQLSDSSGILINQAGLDKAAVMEYLDAVEQQA